VAFRGQHEHSLDSKDRLTIPAKLRSALADGVVLFAGFDPCVEVWPTAAFETFTERSLGGLNPMGGKFRMMSRRFNAGSEDESLDSAGRVRMAKTMLSHGDLSGQCVVVGAGDHLEVWSPERWASTSDDIDAEAGGIAEAIAEED
jgi:MraZ protein